VINKAPRKRVMESEKANNLLEEILPIVHNNILPLTLETSQLRVKKAAHAIFVADLSVLQ
jgi:hypothetical protein